jgi:hypothetical protein
MDSASKLILEGIPYYQVVFTLPFVPFEDHTCDEFEGCNERCPSCGGELILQVEREKPSWHEIMNSPSRPRWYLNPGGVKACRQP